MVEGVARAVDPRSLAVPQREYPVITRPVEQIDLLAAPDGGGGELLVDAGLEMDVVPLQEALGLPQRMVVAPERRAAIARDEPRRVEAGGNIAPALHHRQTHQGLGRGDEHAAGLKGVFVVKRQIKQGHGCAVPVSNSASIGAVAGADGLGRPAMPPIGGHDAKSYRESAPPASPRPPTVKRPKGRFPAPGRLFFCPTPALL